MGATLGELAERIVQVSDVYAARTGVTRDDDWYALKIMKSPASNFRGREIVARDAELLNCEAKEG